MKTIFLTTGTYNTSDYRIIKSFKSETKAMSYLTRIGYKFDKIENNDKWTHQGQSYRLMVD
jgi:hypothetical protein